MADAPLVTVPPPPYSRAWWRVRKGIGILVASIAVSCGLIVAVVDLAIITAYKPPPKGIVQDRERHDGERRQMTYFTVTTFVVAYAVGTLVYRWLGAGAHAESLHQWSRWHLLALHLSGSIWLAFEGWMAWRQAAVIRPSLVVVVFLVALAAWEAVSRRKTLPLTSDDQIGLT